MSEFHDTAPFDEAASVTGEAFDFGGQSFIGTFNFFNRSGDMDEFGGIQNRSSGTVSIALGQFSGKAKPKDGDKITYQGHSPGMKGRNLRLTSGVDHVALMEFNFYEEGTQWASRP